MMALLSNRYIAGVVGLLLTVAAVWGYGKYQYRQGVADTKAEARLAQISIEQGMRYEADRADAEYRGAVLARQNAERTVADQRARINGLLEELRHAAASGAGSGSHDAGADGIGILIECIGEYEYMGTEAARLADKVNGLQGYVRALQ